MLASVPDYNAQQPDQSKTANGKVHFYHYVINSDDVYLSTSSSSSWVSLLVAVGFLTTASCVLTCLFITTTK